MTRQEFNRRKQAIDAAFDRGDLTEQQRTNAINALLDEWQRNGED